MQDTALTHESYHRGQVAVRAGGDVHLLASHVRTTQSHHGRPADQEEALVDSAQFAVGVAQERWPALNLSENEVREAAGGYKRPADQVKELHNRGFVRAYRSGASGKVVLERGHYAAVVAGKFGQATNESLGKPQVAPNRAAFKATFGAKAKA